MYVFISHRFDVLLHLFLQQSHPRCGEREYLKRMLGNQTLVRPHEFPVVLREAHLEIPQTVDEEDIFVPIRCSFPQIRHPLTHLHGRIDSFLKQLREMSIGGSFGSVHKGRVVDRDELAEDLASVAEGKRWCEGCVRWLVM